MPATEFDPHLTAQLHNQILQRAWVGAGRDISSLPSKSWWEESSPVPSDLATRLNPKLIQFLQLAKAIIFDPSSDFHFFYYLIALHGKDDILNERDSPLRRWGDDRLVWLYPSTKTQNDEEIGILFDQETELASFVPDWFDLIWFDLERWPWRPLQCILQTYLDMIDEGKLTVYPDRGKTCSDQLIKAFPWEFHQYTPMDVGRAVSAFTRLLNAIEARLPLSSIHHRLEQQIPGQIALPYPESVIRASSTEVGSFTGQFLLALPARQLNFRYIAPGIRVQSSDEFIHQPFAERPTDDAVSIPLLLFQGEQENKSPWVWPWFPDGNAEDIPAGLYIEPIEDYYSWKSGNDSRLLLPFEIGHSGFARSSNGLPFINQGRGGSTKSDQLYRSDSFSGFSGYLPWDSRSSYLHKVLENWAERVEIGDWLVGEDGVVGGIEKFKEADTKKHWQGYVIPW